MKTFENQYFELQIKNGIMYADYKEGVVITLPAAQTMVADRIKFQQQQNYTTIPIVFNLNIKYANKDARKYLSVKGIEGVSASAFIVKTLATNVLLKTFLLFDKPKLPIATFSDQESAIAWIKKFVSN